MKKEMELMAFKIEGIIADNEDQKKNLREDRQAVALIDGFLAEMYNLLYSAERALIMADNTEK